MTTTYYVAGQGAALPDLPVVTLALVNSALWTLGDPARTSVEFSNDWFKETQTYGVVINDGEATTESIENAGYMDEFDHILYVKVFARKSVKTRPVQVEKICNEIQRILKNNRQHANFVGARISKAVTFRVTDNDGSDHWQSTGVIHFHYVKVDA